MSSTLFGFDLDKIRIYVGHIRLNVQFGPRFEGAASLSAMNGLSFESVLR